MMEKANSITRNVEKRVKQLEEWIEKNGQQCKMMQGHLENGTPEQIYWHYGYLVALKDALRWMGHDSVKFTSSSDVKH